MMVINEIVSKKNAPEYYNKILNNNINPPKLSAQFDKKEVKENKEDQSENLSPIERMKQRFKQKKEGMQKKYIDIQTQMNEHFNSIYERSLQKIVLLSTDGKEEPNFQKNKDNYKKQLINFNSFKEDNKSKEYAKNYKNILAN